MLELLLERGYRYAFMSNSDNLGAVLDPRILAWIASEELPYACEVTERTEADKKGGHIAVLKETGGLILRETAQTPDEDMDAFTDVDRHPYFHVNNLWVDLRALDVLLRERDGVLGLPMIVNEKTVDPADSSSPPVFQLETAMGAAIGVFDGAQAIRVPRSRFVPVKKTTDLLVLRSDAYELADGARIALAAGRSAAPLVELDDDHFKLLADFDARFPAGPPSLAEAERLEVRGRRDVRPRRRGARRRRGSRARGASTTAPCSTVRLGSAPARCSSSSDSLSIRANSHASAIPITIDCSRAMIRPATCWSFSGGQPPALARDVVGVVEQVGREREQDPEEADEQLGRGHVGDRRHPAEPQPRADRRQQVPPVQEAGGAEA